MANFLIYTSHLSLMFIFIFLLPPFPLSQSKFAQQVSDPDTIYNRHANKMSHLHFYFHDIVSGKSPTAITVAGEKNKFGMTAIIDDPLTEGTERGSKVVGRAQGMYSTSSQDTMSLFMAMNFAFTEGKYNGSTLSVLGRNPFLETVREMPVIGGTGLFRFASGYVQAKTKRFNIKTGDAVVEYDVFVMHH